MENFVNSVKFKNAISKLNINDKIVYCDIDGTIYRDSLFLDLINRLVNDGLFSQNKVNTYKKLQKQRKQRKINYEEFLMFTVKEMFEKYLNKIPSKYISNVANKIINNKGGHIFMYTFNKLKELQAQGYKIVFVSGSPMEIVQSFANKFGFDVALGTYLSKDINDKLQREYVLASSQNKMNIISYINSIINPSHIISFGDTTGDIGMLENANIGYAINPTTGLYNAIKYNSNILVIIERKDLILEITKEARKYIINY